MLKKKFRLPLGKHYSFDASFSTLSFLLKTRKNNLDYNRYGVVVSKRIEKTAVRRNKIKRMFFECMQKGVNKEGYDIVCIAKKNILQGSRDQLCEQINSLLAK